MKKSSTLEKSSRKRHHSIGSVSRTIQFLCQMKLRCVRIMIFGFLIDVGPEDQEGCKVEEEPESRVLEPKPGI